jgi:acetylornithine deacetylase/succinyl-diaminopimelate desuccinylase-like protein
MLNVARRLQRLKAEVETRHTAYRIEPAAARHSILMLGGECESGSSFNTVPGTCSFTIDRRINPEEDPAVEKRRLLDELRGNEVELLQEGHASGSEPNSPAGRALASAIEQVLGKPAEFALCPGLLETRFYSARAIPAFAYGPGLLSVSHGPNEFVPLRNLGDCAAIYALTAAALLKPL